MYMDNTNSFNHEFYTSYYDDVKNLKNAVDSLNHWIKIGKDEGRVCNKDQYNRLMANLTSFDFEVFINGNMSLSKFVTFSEDLKLTNKTEQLGLAFDSFKKKFVDKQIDEKQQQTVIPLTIPYICVTNECELNEYLDKWDGLYNKMQEFTKFDAKFYWDMYGDVEAETSLDLFKSWISDGMFNEKMHNATDKNDNLGVFIGGIAKEIGFDWEFFKTNYSVVLTSYDKKNKNKGKQMKNITNTFWYFINYARELKLCLNKNEHDECVAKFVKSHEDANKIIKSVENKKMLPIVVKKYEILLHKVMKLKTIVNSFVLPKFVDLNQNNSYYIDRILSTKYLELLKLAHKCKTDESLVNVVKLLVKKEYNKFSKKGLAITSQDAVKFVLNIVYNGLITSKEENKNAEYIILVKKVVVELLKEFDKEKLINAETQKALENDIDYLINNKMVLKLSRMTSRIAIEVGKLFDF